MEHITNKILIFLSAVFITAGVQAQVPERMSYQAVVRNNKNELVSNKQIGLRISIIQGNINGPKVYREIFSPNPVTNTNGLFTAEIGSGTAITGTFTSIDWANGPYFIQSEIDTTGGINYTLTGTTQLLSVPYALYAKIAETFSGAITETDPAFRAWDKDYNDLNNRPNFSNLVTTDMLNQYRPSINYDDLSGKPDLSRFATIDMLNPDGSNRLDYDHLKNKPDLSIYATKNMLDQINTSIDYNDLTNKPDLGIYATKDMANQNIINLADPVNEKDAATKAYVDALLKKIDELINENLLADGFYDERDSTHYNMVKIGNQIWMAENLKYLPEVTGPQNIPDISIDDFKNPFYFVNGYYGTNVNEAKATDNYNIYGVLYNWPAAMNGASPSSSNPSGVQGICPAGWHIPSSAEWRQLIDYLGGDSIAGGKLKETGTIHWNNPNTGATNESRFTALPGGGTYTGYGDALNFGSHLPLVFYEPGTYCCWWCSTTFFIYEHEYPEHILILQNPFLYPNRTSDFEFNGWYGEDGEYLRRDAFSVRCVKD